MKKYLLFFLLGLMCLILSSSVHAEENDSGPRAAFTVACLDVTYCERGGEACDPSKRGVHWAKISPSSDKLVPNSPFYIVECIQYNHDGELKLGCTSGNSAIDEDIFQENNYQILQSHINYQFEGAEPAGGYVADAAGTPQEIYWKSYTPQDLYRFWRAYSPVTPEPQEAPIGSAGGHQLGTLTFPIVSSEHPCGGVSYDPYGRVFDAVTLEPIQRDLRIALLQKIPNPAPTPYIANEFSINYANITNPNIGTRNPQQLGLDGSFNFNVVDGTYALTPLENPFYDFKSQAETQAVLSPNYNRIYSDFYYNATPPMPIVQSGGIPQHRDIPLVPKNGTGHLYPLQSIWNERSTDATGNIIFEGRVTHPYAEVWIRKCDISATCTDERLYTFNGRCNHANTPSTPCPAAGSIFTGGPDKDGNYRIVRRQSELTAVEEFFVEIRPIPLNEAILSQGSKTSFSQAIAYIKDKLNNLIEVSAQESRSVTFSQPPIPLYLEGYAYNANGDLVPNATIEIYTEVMSRRPVATVQADEKGYFKITSDYLPRSNYTIGIVSPSTGQNSTTKSTLKTSEFLAQNADFIEAERIQPYVFVTETNNPRRNVTPTFVPPAKVSPVAGVPDSTDVIDPELPSVQPESLESQQRNNMLLVGVIFLLLLGTAGVLLGVYIYKKRMREPEI